MANDRHCVKHDFYASSMLLVLFYLFGAALAAVQLLTWSCSAALGSCVALELGNLYAAAAGVLPGGGV